MNPSILLDTASPQEGTTHQWKMYKESQDKFRLDKILNPITFKIILLMGSLTDIQTRVSNVSSTVVTVTFFCYTSYITVTYVVEAMACANAMLQYRRRITGETDDGSPPPSRSGNGSRSGSGSSNGSNSNLTTYSVNVTHSPSHERVPVTERSSLLQGPIGEMLL